MSADWPTIALGDLCSIARGGSPRPIKNFITDDPDGINWIKIGDTQKGGRYIDSTAEKIKPEGISRSRFVEAGSFLLSNSMSFGRPYILRTSGCIHDGWLVLEPDYERVNQDFLYHVLGSRTVFDQFDRLAAGSTVRNLNIGLVEGVEIPLPPLEEQRRIVAVLDEAFEGLARARAHAEANLENARELFENFLSGKMASESDDWVTHSFGDPNVLKIVDGDRGANYPKKADFLNEGHCLFLNTKNVRPDGFNFDETMFISKERDQVLRKGKLLPRDAILTTRGTIGNVAFFDDTVPYANIRINSGMLILRPNEDIIRAEFLFELLRSGVIKEQIEQHVSGAAQPQLPIRSLVKFMLPAPKSTDEQLQIVEQLKRLNNEVSVMVEGYERKAQDLDDLRQSLLQKAFAGELTGCSE